MQSNTGCKVYKSRIISQLRKILSPETRLPTSSHALNTYPTSEQQQRSHHAPITWFFVSKIGKSTSVTREGHVAQPLALTFLPETTKWLHPNCQFEKIVPELKNAQGRVTLPPATLAGAGLAHTPVAVLNPGQAAAATTATPIFAPNSKP